MFLGEDILQKKINGEEVSLNYAGITEALNSGNYTVLASKLLDKYPDFFVVIDGVNVSFENGFKDAEIPKEVSSSLELFYAFKETILLELKKFNENPAENSENKSKIRVINTLMNYEKAMLNELFNTSYCSENSVRKALYNVLFDIFKVITVQLSNTCKVYNLCHVTNHIENLSLKD